MSDAEKERSELPSVRREINAELRQHLDELTEDLVKEGMSAEQARRVAADRFGNLDRLAAEVSVVDAHGVGHRARWWEAISHDLRFAWRTLRRTPGYLGI